MTRHIHTDRLRSTLHLAALALLASTTARAQYSDGGRGAAQLYGAPVHSEGPGIKLGESLVLHPGIAVGAGFDSNLFFANSAPLGAAYVMFRPHLALATNSPQRGGGNPQTVEFRLHLAAGARLPFIVDTKRADSATILSRNYVVDVNAGALLNIFPQGNVGFELSGDFDRSSQSPYFATGQGNINRDAARLGLHLKIRPGGRRFEIGLRYMPGLSFFEPSQRGDPDYTQKNVITNDIQLRLAWKFFPKTALYLQANDAITTYVSRGCSTPPNQYPLRAVVGLIGLITTKLAVDFNIGYGNTLIPAGNVRTDASCDVAGNRVGYEGRNDHKAVGLLNLTWKPTLLTTLQLGYRQDFAASAIGTYYTLAAPYLSLAQQLWRFQAIARLSYEFRHYHGSLVSDGMLNGSTSAGVTVPERMDHVVDLHLQLDLPIKDWFYIGVGNDLAYNASNCRFVIQGASGAAPCTYVRNDVWLRLGVAY